MSISISELTERLRNNESIESITRSLVPPLRKRMLAYCASVRSFEQGMVDHIFRPASGITEEQVSFSQLTDHYAVEPVPRSRGRFRLKARERVAMADELSALAPPGGSPPPGSPGLSKQLVTYYRSQEGETEADQLYHLALADPGGAKTFFDQEFIQADLNFDLARCDSLVRVLDQRNETHGLDSSLADLLNRRRVYLGTRGLWSEEFFRTVHYFNREQLARALEDLLEPGNKNKWILQLYAKGGMGKTMFIRWLIARRCVPEPYRIPCARLDFDFPRPLVLPRAPWRVHLFIAEQLNVQLPGAPFHELLEEFPELLLPEDVPVPAERLKKLKVEIPERFASALNSAVADKPVIIILDTMEEALFRDAAQVLPLLDQLRTLRQSFPLLRLVLSGRYDLKLRVPGFRKAYGPMCRTLKVKPFTSTESQDYLKENRDIPGLKMRRIITRMAGGNPFKLSLLSDLVLTDKDMTPEELESYRNADLAYLIHRIVDRIHPPAARWVLRYGVVPRKLTPLFLEKVMKPHLLRAMSGDDSYDDHCSNLPDAMPEKEEKFPTRLIEPAQEELDTGALWQMISRYAGRYSWVSSGGEERDTLSFHVEVVYPMRYLLQPNQVFLMLHRDARAYYGAKAEAAAEAVHWVRWAREAVYHRFQEIGAMAAPYWQNYLEEARRRWPGDIDARFELANEVLGSDYMDDEQPLAREDGTPMISLETLAEAYYRSAFALLEKIRAKSGGGGMKKEVEQLFNKAESIGKNLGTDAVLAPENIPDRLRAAIAGFHGKSGEAADILITVLSGSGGPAEKVATEMEVVDLTADSDPETAISHLLTVEEILRDNPRVSFPVQLPEVQYRLARLCAAAGRYEEADRRWRDHIQQAAEEQNPARQLSGTLELCRLYLDTGQYRPAHRLVFDKSLDEIQLDEDIIHRLRLGLKLKREEVLLALLSPFEASYLKDKTHSRVPEEIYAGIAELKGRRLAMEMIFRKAMNTLDRAIKTWSAAGFPGDARRCLFLTIQMQLWEVGNLKEASALLKRAERLSFKPGSDDWVRFRLLCAEYLRAIEDDSTKPAELIDEIQKQMDRSVTPITRAMVAVEAIRHSSGDWIAPHVIAQAITALTRLKPPSARLEPFKRLTLGPALQMDSVELKKSFLDLVPLPPAVSIEFPVFALTAAEIFRRFGEQEKASSLLGEACKAFWEKKNMLGLLQVFSLRNRSRAVYRDIPFPATDELEQFLQPLADEYPAFYGAWHLELARFYYSLDEIEKGLNHVATAYEHLSAESYPTRHLGEAAELEGILARLGGYTQESKKAFETAVTVFEQLNREKTVARLREDAAGQQEDVPRHEDFFLLRVQPGSKGVLRIDTRSPGHSAVQRKRVKPVRNAPHWLQELLETGSKDYYSYSFLKSLLGNWREVSRDIFQLLHDPYEITPLLQGISRAPGASLRLEFEPGPLSAVPWEALAAFGEAPYYFSLAPDRGVVFRAGTRRGPREDKRLLWFQVLLNQFLKMEMPVDGIWGEQTRDAVTRFQKEFDLPVDGFIGKPTRDKLRELNWSGPPKVLLLQPSAYTEKVIFRGTRSAGVRLDDVYRENGLEPIELDAPTLSDVSKQLDYQRVDIIHIVASLKVSTQLGVLYLDFGSGTDVHDMQSQTRGPRGSSRGGPGEDVIFSVSSLANLLHQSASNAPPPLVVLDISTPPGQLELLRQLCLRNAYAAELFNKLNSQDILAAGFIDDEKKEDFYDMLVRGFAAGESIGRITRTLRRISSTKDYSPPGTPEFFSGVLPYVSIALFCETPEAAPV